ncbi:MAG: hypothetical protein HYZ27_04705 [Deltaproteobacteria bacterium]|nr:hypothetical protein [Deltaproteobacteria bacterium]
MKRLAIIAALVAAACSEDTLGQDPAVLDIEPWPLSECKESPADNTRMYLCSEPGVEPVVIDLGETPVYATKWATFRLSNPTTFPVDVSSVTYAEGRVTGQRWRTLEVVPAPTQNRFTSTEALDFSVPAHGEVKLRVGYAPIELGAHEAVVVITSNATNGATREVIVLGEAVFAGEPDIQVEYGAYAGPNPDLIQDGGDCVDWDADGRVEGCMVPLSDAMRFGNIGPGGVGTQRLIIRNTAECTPYVGVDACTLCSLTVARDPTRQNLGLAIKASNDGSCNEPSAFSFVGSSATPFEIPQREENVDRCNPPEPGDVRLLVSFQAPMDERHYCATIVIESADTDEPLIEIPVDAWVRNAPVAIADFYCDPADINTCTTATDIRPLKRAYFDAHQSYDPIDPSDPTLIQAWSWEVLEYPVGANPSDFDMQGWDADVFSFWVPLAGHYVVRLTVWNNAGIQSGDTALARIEFDAVPKSDLHVELTWDDLYNDQDVHLVNLGQEPLGRVCNDLWDCHYRNCKPGAPLGPLNWDGTANADPDPRLDRDDLNGNGPENTNIDIPIEGDYRVYVHFYSNPFGEVPPTRNTVRIYLNGFQVAEYRRTLIEVKDLWAVAEITWQSGGTGFVTTYPSDAPPEVGAVKPMPNCTNPGFQF